MKLPLFNALNTCEYKNIASKKSKHLHPITQCKMYFNVLNQLCMDHQCDRTDGQNGL